MMLPNGAAQGVEAEESREHWAWQRLVRPSLPPPPPENSDPQGAWGRNPIDAFILAKLGEHELTPSPEADRRTLIRRLYFDLIGLPPTPAEVEAFAGDDDPLAYEKLVERLLASPHYGERWARHWMDVSHFAETHGHDQDRPRENAWPYRDYLIRSFNDDKPYGRFIREQIAGDVLYPDDPWATVALGFLAAGPWDESSQMGIKDGTTDKLIAQYLDRDDMLATALGTFNSVTVHCARCHDHKFDPITQAEYYALQAVFAGVDRHERPYDADPAVHARRQALGAERDRIASMPAAELLDADVTAAVARWERRLAEEQSAWVVMDVMVISAAHGSIGEEQADGSILFSEPRPEKDTYTVTGRNSLARVTAVRLEVLTDPSLPHNGPGRQDNGNLHLSEFRIHAAPPEPPEVKQASGVLPEVGVLAIRRATADFNQAGWTIEHAIDGKPETAWGIHPNVGQAHEAVFELTEPVRPRDGTIELTIVLEQLHGGGHLIGRPRITATAAEDPSLAKALPPGIAAILGVAHEQRNDEQRAALARYVLMDELEEKVAKLPPPEKTFAVTGEFEPDGNFKPGRGPREVHLLRRGSVDQPIAPAQPGSLGCIEGLPADFDLTDATDEGARRAALARWVADESNSLTWRSIVNRMWHYHFGTGIVDTPNDFGGMGGRPSHPQLLDWLAVELRDSGGSLKHLHRLIVHSAAYRQASQHREAPAKIDAENRLLWRFHRRRLDAEQVRDAVLSISGLLDRRMGGPSVRQFIQSPGIHVTPEVNYQAFDVDDPVNRRRSVYRFLFRTLPDPLMETLDCPAGSQHAPVRSEAVTPLQALAMMNSPFMVRQAEHIATRVSGMADDVPGRIRALYRLALNREPTPPEIEALSVYARKHGMAALCRVVINSNEFMFLD